MMNDRLQIGSHTILSALAGEIGDKAVQLAQAKATITLMQRELDQARERIVALESESKERDAPSAGPRKPRSASRRS